MAKDKKIDLPSSVKALKWSKKKWAKKNGLKYDGKKMSKADSKANKKRANKEYPVAMIEGLNAAVEIISENPKEEEIEEIKTRIEGIIVQSDLMAKIADIYAKHPKDYKNLIFLPNIIMNTLLYYEKGVDLTEEELVTAASLDRDALTEFCEKILKKRRKRYEEMGLTRTLAFRMACVIPTAKILGKPYWYKVLVRELYDMAETEHVSVKAVLNAVAKIDKHPNITKDEIKKGFWSEFIFMRNSNRLKQLNDTQRELHEELQQLCLKYLDKDPKLCKEILKRYVERRRKAEKNGNDGRRIFKFTDHANSNSPYRNIKEVVEKMIKKDEDVESLLS